MAGDWPTVAAAAVGAIAGMLGGTFLEMYKRRRDRRGTAYALAGAISASLREVRQARLVDGLTSLTAELDKNPDKQFTASKMFQD
jgi:hypothetical protein